MPKINQKELNLLAEKVKQLRLNKGLTQEQLCEYSGVYRSALSTIEDGRGNPTISTLIKIAKALELNVKDLIDF